MTITKTVTPSVPFRKASLHSSPLKRDNAESTEYGTNQKELSCIVPSFRGRSEALGGLAECQAVPSEGNTVLCVTEDPQGSTKAGWGSKKGDERNEAFA